MSIYVTGDIHGYPVRLTDEELKRYGGMVHKLKDNIYHLMRGEVYSIDGKSFFTFGGASSFDRYLREEHVSWWEEEILNQDERLNAIRNLIKADFKVDYVITHTAPRRFVNNLSVDLQGAGSCPVAKFLDELSSRIKCNRWFFGHFHLDTCVDGVITCLYEHIEKI